MNTNSTPGDGFTRIAHEMLTRFAPPTGHGAAAGVIADNAVDAAASLTKWAERILALQVAQFTPTPATARVDDAALDAAIQQAQTWKMEANAANATIAEIYRLVGSKAGNWNGAEPVRKALEAAALTPGAAPMGGDVVLIRQAVARGWCAPENSHKVMDVDLAHAIAREVIDALAATPAPVAAGGAVDAECACPTHGDWIAADDVKRLVRELDVALNGEMGASKQASLCDVVAQAKHVARRLNGPIIPAFRNDGNSEADFIADGARDEFTPPHGQEAAPVTGSALDAWLDWTRRQQPPQPSDTGAQDDARDARALYRRLMHGDVEIGEAYLTLRVVGVLPTEDEFSAAIASEPRT